MTPATLVTLCLSIVADVVPAGSGDTAICECAAARNTNAWCAACEVGYLAGVAIPSRPLFEVLDPNGHAIDTASIECATCKEAIASDGFCEVSRMGFVAGKAYLSRLAHHAARGRVREATEIECETCRRNARTHGWCAKCEVAMAGRLELRDRDELESARDALKILRAALGRLARCESCAIATVSGGRCRRCRLAYVEGVPVAVRSTTVLRRQASSEKAPPRDESRADTPRSDDRKDVPRAKG